MSEKPAKNGRAALLRRLFREDPAAFAELVENLKPPRPEKRLDRHHLLANYPRMRATATFERP